MASQAPDAGSIQFDRFWRLEGPNPPENRSKGAQKRKCPPRRMGIPNPCLAAGDVHGRIRFDGFTTVKTCVDWILWLGGILSQENFPPGSICPTSGNLLACCKNFRAQSVCKPLCKVLRYSGPNFDCNCIGFEQGLLRAPDRTDHGVVLIRISPSLVAIPGRPQNPRRRQSPKAIRIPAKAMILKNMFAGPCRNSLSVSGRPCDVGLIVDFGQ